METLFISGFGGLKEATVKTAPILVLIGEQAMGKSIVAKLLYYFRNLSAEPLVMTQNSEEEGRKWSEREFGVLFPPDDWGDSAFKIRYEHNEEWVQVTRGKTASGTRPSGVEVRWSGFYAGAWEKWSKSVAEAKAVFERGDVDGFGASIFAIKNEIRKEVQQTLGGGGAFEQIFVPAGRGFFAQVSGNIFAMLAANEGDLRQTFDPFLLRFGRWLEYNKRNFKSLGFFDARATEHGRFPYAGRYVARILKAEYVRDNDQDMLVHPDGRRVGLAHASSAQQEILPLLLTIGRVLANGQGQGSDVYVEEPEAHIFPESQRDMVKLLAAAFNLRRGRVRFVITTHSPYILSVFGNLMEAGKRYASPEPHKKLERIVPKILALRERDLRAYALRNGGADLIMDRKTGMIKSKIIDDVSLAIDKQFDQLLWET
jgi:hypothetical protein